MGEVIRRYPRQTPPLPGWHPPADELYALWRLGKPVAPRLTAFIEFLSEVLSGPIATANKPRAVRRRSGGSRSRASGR